MGVDMPTTAIGRPYSSSKSQPIFPNDSEAKPFKIYFNYHVANKDLKIVKTDPKFLAVTGKALGSDEKFFEVTGNTTAEGANTKTKVDLSTYTIVPYSFRT